ncbi:MAG: hypothetical protein V1897_01415 [Pseudomonadota bacterium]
MDQSPRSCAIRHREITAKVFYSRIGIDFSLDGRNDTRSGRKWRQKVLLAQLETVLGRDVTGQVCSRIYGGQNIDLSMPRSLFQISSPQRFLNELQTILSVYDTINGIMISLTLFSYQNTYLRGR